MEPWPYPFWIAHRGAGREAPENTLAALRRGLAAGLRGFECDVQLSADGVPFLLHDDTLARTTDADGLACARPWAELALCDAGSWHSPEYAGEPVASLAAWLRLARSLGAALNLELKPSPGQAARVGAGVARWLRTQAPEGPPLQPPPLLSSFEPEALQAAAAADAAWPRALLSSRWAAALPSQARALGAVAVVLQHRALDASAVAALHAAGLRALAYTVNDDADVQRLRAAGVDGLITDRLDLHVAQGQRAAPTI